MGKVKRLSNNELREAIKRNELQEGITESVDYVRSHLENVLIGGVVIIVLAILVPYYFSNQADTRAAASQALREAHQVLQQSINSGDVSLEQLRQARSRYQAVVSSYPGSGPAIEAELATAQTNLRLGEFDQAIQGFQAFLASHGGALAGLAQAGLGQAHEAKGAYAEAAKHFQAVVSNPEAANRGIALLDAARCLRLAGNSAEADQALKKARDEAKQLGLTEALLARQQG